MSRGLGSREKGILAALDDRLGVVPREVWHSARSLGLDSPARPSTPAAAASFRRAVASLREKRLIESRLIAQAQRTDATRYKRGHAGARERLMLRLPLSYDDLFASVRDFRRAERIRLRLLAPGTPLVGKDREFLEWYDRYYSLPEGCHVDMRELVRAARNFPSVRSHLLDLEADEGAPFLD